MPTVADTHVHIYDEYDIAGFLRSAMSGLNGLVAGWQQRHPGDRTAAADWIRVLALTERNGCRFFQRLEQGEPGLLPDGFRLHATAEAGAVLVEYPDGGRVYLVAGRQVVTRERLEVLALTVDMDYADGKPVRAVLAAVREAGGIPVLSWAPGKWFFQRGRLMKALVAGNEPGSLLLGDTSLRPVGWPEPALMRRARALGFGVIAGSDPLPFRGEECRVGRYGVVYAGKLEEERPVSSLRSMILSRQGVTLVGRRNAPLTVLTRLKRNRDSKT